MLKMNKYYIFTLTLLGFCQTHAQALEPTEQMITDSFTCVANEKESTNVLNYLNRHKQEMTDHEVQKLDFPEKYAVLKQPVRILGMTAQYYAVNKVEVDKNHQFMTFSLYIPHQNSLQLIETLAKKYQAVPDQESHQMFKEQGLNIRMYHLSETQTEKYKRQLTMNNAWLPDEQHNPWAFVEISCAYIPK